VSKPLEANSDIANMIHGAVGASLNNKFVAMSEKFESTMNSRLDRIEAKFGKQFSGNDINASTYNTKNSKDSTLDDFSNLHIPKVPIGVPLIHRWTTIGASAGEGSTMAATNAMMPHTVVYSEPSAYVPNSSLQHVPNTLPNQTSTYNTPQPTVNPGSARPRTALGMEGFREEMLEIFRQNLVQSLKIRVGHIKDRILIIMSTPRTHRDLKYQSLLNLVGMMVEVNYNI
jgi:hypothetical protein